jgi:hypothetical protein
LNYAECIFVANLPRLDSSFDGIDGTQNSGTDVSPTASLFRSSAI